MVAIIESTKHVIESVSKLANERKLKEGLSTGQERLEIKHSGNEESTPENDIADLDDYSAFVQGINNRQECYDLDQRHETEEHMCIALSKEINDSNLYLKGDYYYPISPNSYYPISPADSVSINLDFTLTKDEKSLIDEFCRELANAVTESDKDYGNKLKKPTNAALKHIMYITDKYLQKE
ncbi:hypothetical protein [Candidatus Wolbachia massiliensis]|uniref:Uncharacterized protein n=1 Tax=Candidatus Wolbachia massiliensis TaxID=1845000 RepID=A0A7M3U2T0_9RICK|nr:hypothetical protein [Candidatus Wolbachia massiliensis]QOD38715.1 hypothetical protein ID128_02580 [Candidatus Wolbachia massiliensis]